jgi:pimeloyl-ACP methyl ester carboxylesterase
VFVHGFLGGVERSWRAFPTGTAKRRWWKESDLLFVRYDSARDEIAGVAFELRDRLPDFYPTLRTEYLQPATLGELVSKREYGELVVAGHSLGGVIVRYAFLELAASWIRARRNTPDLQPPRLLEAQTRLFSPASAGFRPGGELAMFRSSGAWSAIEMKLRKSTAFTDLDPTSRVIVNTQRRTESLVAREPSLTALSADVVWARPDNVVLAEAYETDNSSTAVKGKLHREVCKPNDAYTVPWVFVEGEEVSQRRQSHEGLARIFS